MSQKKSTRPIIIGLIVIAVAALAWLAVERTRPGVLDAFAQCVQDSEATFYGAFWCPYCNSQKELFGRSAKYLPYEECSLPNRNQTAACSEAGIAQYPTWRFADGTEQVGPMSVEALAEKTGCSIPEGYVSEGRFDWEQGQTLEISETITSEEITIPSEE